MNAIIQQFQNELTFEERVLFEARARHAGHRPGQHLKTLLFSTRPAPPGMEKQGSREQQEPNTQR